jgi:hypothetical protein
MTSPDSDSDFEDFLARRSPLHRRLAEGDGHEPSAELDRIVLAKAREAIKRPSDTAVYRSPQWALPVGLAASVLLIFAVVLNFARVPQQPGMAAAPTAATGPAATAAISSERASIADEGESIEPLAEAKAEADAAPAAAVVNTDALLAKQDAAPPAPALRAEQEAPPAAASVAGNLTAPALASIASRAKVAATPATAPAMAQGAPLADAPVAAQSQLVAANDAEVAARDQPSRGDADNQTYTASANQSAAASPSMGALEETTVTGARRVRGSLKRPAASSAPAVVAAEKAKHPDPEAWLREIGELRVAGRDSEARRELEAFRKAYPDHAVPPSTAEPPPGE